MLSFRACEESDPGMPRLAIVPNLICHSEVAGNLHQGMHRPCFRPQRLFSLFSFLFSRPPGPHSPLPRVHWSTASAQWPTRSPDPGEEMQQMQVPHGGNAGPPPCENPRHSRQMQEMQQMHPFSHTEANSIARTQRLPDSPATGRPTIRRRDPPQTSFLFSLSSFLKRGLLRIKSAR